MNEAETVNSEGLPVARCSGAERLAIPCCADECCLGRCRFYSQGGEAPSVDTIAGFGLEASWGGPSISEPAYLFRASTAPQVIPIQPRRTAANPPLGPRGTCPPAGGYRWADERRLYTALNLAEFSEFDQIPYLPGSSGNPSDQPGPRPGQFGEIVNPEQYRDVYWGVETHYDPYFALFYGTLGLYLGPRGTADEISLEVKFYADAANETGSAIMYVNGRAVATIGGVQVVVANGECSPVVVIPTAVVVAPIPYRHNGFITVTIREVGLLRIALNTDGPDPMAGIESSAASVDDCCGGPGACGPCRGLASAPETAVAQTSYSIGGSAFAGIGGLNFSGGIPLTTGTVCNSIGSRRGSVSGAVSYNQADFIVERTSSSVALRVEWFQLGQSDPPTTIFTATFYFGVDSKPENYRVNINGAILTRQGFIDENGDPTSYPGVTASFDASPCFNEVSFTFRFAGLPGTPSYQSRSYSASASFTRPNVPCPSGGAAGKPCLGCGRSRESIGEVVA